MADLALVLLLQCAFWLVGWPVTRLLPAGASRMLATPVFGLCVLALGCTIGYRFGVPPPFCALALCIAAASLIAITAWKNPRLAARAIADLRTPILVGAALIALLLSSKWLGDPSLGVFQGNIYDHFNYISAASSFHHYSFGQISALADLDYPLRTASELGSAPYFATSALDSRPAVPILYAAFANITQPTALGAYAFCTALQVNFFFSAGALLVCLFPTRPIAAHFTAAALTLGFYTQYVFDINAWAELAAMPVALIALYALVAIVEHIAEAGKPPLSLLLASSPLAVAGAGLIYIYPECLPVWAPAIAAVGAVVLIRIWRKPAASAALASPVIGMIMAVALCLPTWNSTLGFLVQQLTMAQAAEVDWWRYYDAYLIAPSEGTFRQALTFTLGALGVYFTSPQASWPAAAQTAATWIAWAWIICLAIALVFAVTKQRSSERGAILLLILAALGSFLAPIYLLQIGSIWAAGKALSMTWPLVFCALCAPLVAYGGRVAWPALLLIAAHFSFGVSRPFAASIPHAVPGVIFDAPYPISLHSELRSQFDWRWDALARSLRRCRAISISVGNNFVDRYAQLMVTDIGRPWSTTAPLQSAVGITPPFGQQVQTLNPDCILSSQLPSVRVPNVRLFLLTKTHPAVDDFVQGRVNYLEIAVRDELIFEEKGLFQVETTARGALRWTSGDAEFHVPHQVPVSFITLELWPFRAPGVDRLRISINGSNVYDGRPTGSFRERIDVRRFAQDGLLHIVLHSEVGTPPGDTRQLGFPIRSMMITR